MQWSDQQNAIFDWFKGGSGNLVVRARAGTGKTTTIVQAISYAPENSILLGAFNKRIASELQTKLTNPKAVAKTFHALGYGMILGNWKGAVLDQYRSDSMARELFPDVPDPIITSIKKLASLAKNICPFFSIEKLIDICYVHDIDADEQMIDLGWNISKIATHAAKLLDKAAERNGTFDFDDMLYIPIKNSWIRKRYDLVVIDEAQDMNASQLIMAKKLGKARIVVVGDDKQAIYAFRGADSNSIDRLKGELSAKELGLTITYRCPKNVVQHIKWIVPDFIAADEAPDGVVRSLAYSAMIAEAEPGDFILSRINAPLTRTCFKLLALDKRACVEGREIGQTLKKIVKGLKATTIEEMVDKLQTWHTNQIERITKTASRCAETKIEHVNDQVAMLNVFAENATTVDDLLIKLETMFQHTDGGKLDVIVCSSVHKAKGLERNRVYGLCDTLYPGGSKNSSCVEERNIEYVMVTRAKSEFICVTGIH
jgi:superfamily I DNA/RNA helicase